MSYKAQKKFRRSASMLTAFLFLFLWFLSRAALPVYAAADGVDFPIDDTFCNCTTPCTADNANGSCDLCAQNWESCPLRRSLSANAAPSQEEKRTYKPLADYFGEPIFHFESIPASSSPSLEILQDLYSYRDDKGNLCTQTNHVQMHFLDASVPGGPSLLITNTVFITLEASDIQTVRLAVTTGRVYPGALLPFDARTYEGTPFHLPPHSSWSVSGRNVTDAEMTSILAGFPSHSGEIGSEKLAGSAVYLGLSPDRIINHGVTMANHYIDGLLAKLPTPVAAHSLTSHELQNIYEGFTDTSGAHYIEKETFNYMTISDMSLN